MALSKESVSVGKDVFYFLPSTLAILQVELDQLREFGEKAELEKVRAEQIIQKIKSDLREEKINTAAVLIRRAELSSVVTNCTNINVLALTILSDLATTGIKIEQLLEASPHLEYLRDEKEELRKLRQNIISKDSAATRIIEECERLDAVLKEIQ